MTFVGNLVIRKKWRDSRGEQLVGFTVCFLETPRGVVGGRKSRIVLCVLRSLPAGKKAT